MDLTDVRRERVTVIRPKAHDRNEHSPRARQSPAMALPTCDSECRILVSWLAGV